jgi:peptidoglycan/xylan/chitin deacetylase (PgdA/CDA1 family)
MRKLIRILVVLVTLGVAVPVVPAAAGRAPVATTAYAYPLPSSVTAKATRANGEVVVLSTARRVWISTQAWNVYAGAGGQLQYRAPGATTWTALKEYTTDGRGMSTYVDRSGLPREYRSVLRPTPYVLASISPTAVPAWCSVPTALRGMDLTKVPTSAKVVALTFDAGANGDAVGSILSTLRLKAVPATFFLTGRFATTFPELTRTIMSRYPTGNHSDTHPDLTRTSLSNALLEVRRGQLNIRAVGGHDPHPYWRFPFGAVNSSLVSLVNQECYVSFRWTVDTLGWQGTSGGMTATKVRDRVLAGLTPGEIVLMHVGSHPSDHSMLDAAALPSVIDALRARGYGFVTLESVVADW